MKFKRNEDYQRPVPIPTQILQEPVENPVAKPEPLTLFVWECIACPSKAVVLHRGTGYCRACYEKRNYQGTLIG